MRVFVTAKAHAKSPRVTATDDAHFVVAVREPARDGKANAAIIKVLADHFGVAPSRIALIRGAAAKKKVFLISY